MKIITPFCLLLLIVSCGPAAEMPAKYKNTGTSQSAIDMTFGLDKLDSFFKTFLNNYVNLKLSSEDYAVSKGPTVFSELKALDYNQSEEESRVTIKALIKSAQKLASEYGQKKYNKRYDQICHKKKVPWMMVSNVTNEIIGGMNNISMKKEDLQECQDILNKKENVPYLEAYERLIQHKRLLQFKVTEYIKVKGTEALKGKFNSSLEGVSSIGPLKFILPLFSILSDYTAFEDRVLGLAIVEKDKQKIKYDKLNAAAIIEACDETEEQLNLDQYAPASAERQVLEENLAVIKELRGLMKIILE